MSLCCLQIPKDMFSRVEAQLYFVVCIYSFYELWQNCLNGAADFKELIPEFYEGDGEYMVHTGVSYFLCDHIIVCAVYMRSVIIIPEHFKKGPRYCYPPYPSVFLSILLSFPKLRNQIQPNLLRHLLTQVGHATMHFCSTHPTSTKGRAMNY